MLRSNLPAWLIAGLLLVSGPLSMAQPPLPAGLGNEPDLPSGIERDQEPSLPGGLGSEDDSVWEEEAWSSAEDLSGGGNGFGGIRGFSELRLGQRLESVDNQRNASLSEIRLELEKQWDWSKGAANITTDFLYDDIEPSQQNDLETGAGWFDLRETWVQYRPIDSMDVKAGRQILTWGVGDLVFINDLFPKDWNSFLAGRDEQYLKAPSDAIRVGFYSDLANINLIYTPRFDADRYIDGRRLSYFSPLAGTVVGRNMPLVTDRPDKTGRDDEWAVRAYRAVGSYEVALYGYHGFWKSPGGFNAHTGEALFPRLRVLGASIRGPLGPGIFSLETGYYRSADDSDGSDPFINNDELRGLAGFEWEAMRNMTLALQYYVEALRDYGQYRLSLPPGMEPRDEYRQLMTLRLTRLAMNQNLTLGLFMFYSPTDKDAYIRPKAQYKVSDNWSVEGGMNIFTGREHHTFFGQFEDNSNIYAAIRYSF